ncbi:hypothetical protein STEG23_031845 [Scotinomys teguina]
MEPVCFPPYRSQIHRCSPKPDPHRDGPSFPKQHPQQDLDHIAGSSSSVGCLVTYPWEYNALDANTLITGARGVQFNRVSRYNSSYTGTRLPEFWVMMLLLAHSSKFEIFDAMNCASQIVASSTSNMNPSCGRGRIANKRVGYPRNRHTIIAPVGTSYPEEQKSQNPERRAGVMGLLVSGYAGKTSIYTHDSRTDEKHYSNILPGLVSDGMVCGEQEAVLLENTAGQHQALEASPSVPAGRHSVQVSTDFWKARMSVPNEHWIFSGLDGQTPEVEALATGKPWSPAVDSCEDGWEPII